MTMMVPNFWRPVGCLYIRPQKPASKPMGLAPQVPVPSSCPEIFLPSFFSKDASPSGSAQHSRGLTLIQPTPLPPSPVEGADRAGVPPTTHPTTEGLSPTGRFKLPAQVQPVSKITVSPFMLHYRLVKEQGIVFISSFCHLDYKPHEN